MECVLRMTRKSAHPRPNFASAGCVDCRQQLSFDSGVIRSEGRTQASSRVSTARMRQSSISANSPSALEVLHEQDEWLLVQRQTIDAKIHRGIAELERGEGIPEDELYAHLERLKVQRSEAALHVRRAVAKLLSKRT